MVIENMSFIVKGVLLDFILTADIKKLKIDCMKNNYILKSFGYNNGK